MSQAEVRAALGAPQETGPSPGALLLRWRYSGGITIDFDYAPGVPDSHVRAIEVAAPFAGLATNGLRIGETRETFKRAFAGYPVTEIENTACAVDDAGLTVFGSFDVSDRLSSLGIYQGNPPNR